MSAKSVLIFVSLLIAFVYSFPAYDDSEVAATGDHHGRVQIKVYRGPSDHHFAPWGFWVKQPADDESHH